MNNMTIKKGFFIILLLHINIVIGLGQISQNQNLPPQTGKLLNKKWYYGGNIGGNITNSGFYIDLSPYIAYRLTEKASIGSGVMLQYIQFNRSTSSASYGFRMFGRYDILKNVFGYTEYAFLNSPTQTNNTGNLKASKWHNSWYLGAGAQRQIFPGISANLMVLYDMLATEIYTNVFNLQSPYSNPSIRGGFSIGLQFSKTTLYKTISFLA